MGDHFKGIIYRFYDKEVYFDFMDKIRRDDLSFQGFIDKAIEDYLKGEYNPENKK